MTSRSVTCAALAVALSVMATNAADKAGPVYSGTILDFTEERYNEPFITDSRRMHSCVNRDYTLDTTYYVVVLRDSTCYPGLHRALPVVVGSSINYQQKGNRIALFDGRGKAKWMKVFKMTQKSAPASSDQPAPATSVQTVVPPPAPKAEPAPAPAPVADAVSAPQKEPVSVPMKETAAVLTNVDVIRMVQAGLSSEVIIATIRNCKPGFQLHPAATDQLMKAGVTEETIKAMAARQYGR